MKTMQLKIRYFSTVILSLGIFSIVFSVNVFSQSKSETRSFGQGVALSELKKELFTAEASDLPSIKTTDLQTDAVFRVYFDQASAAVAEKSIPTLAAFYRQVAEFTAVDAGKVKWHSIVFTQKKDYTPPQRNDVRWVIEVGDNGQLSEHGIKDFYLVIPHEQVHAVQKTFIPHHSPRWFGEGQATWAGLKVTERWNAELARRHREALAEGLSKTAEPINLRRWGSVQIKGGAMLRQMTPEQIEKLKQNPGSSIGGTFTFSQDDVITDLSNEQARYAASLKVFEEMEKTAPGKLNNLFKAIWERNAELDTASFAKLSLEHLKLDVNPLLN